MKVKQAEDREGKGGPFRCRPKWGGSIRQGAEGDGGGSGLATFHLTRAVG